jgi:hypothetical protein
MDIIFTGFKGSAGDGDQDGAFLGARGEIAVERFELGDDHDLVSANKHLGATELVLLVGECAGE